MTPLQRGIGTNKLLGAGADAAQKPQRTQALTADISRQTGVGIELSDSHLMIFDVDLVLFSKRNQHNGSSFAFIFVGAVWIDR